MNSIGMAGGLSDIMRSAGTAITRGAAGVSRDAAVVAGASSVDTGQVLTALIDSRQQLMYTQAGAKMMETASQMMGTLIDIRA
jgi:flagellar hook protein FlgE